MRLDRDEFVVKYDATRTSATDLIAIIRKAGYTANVVSGETRSQVAASNTTPSDNPIIAKALARAKEEQKPLVLDFYANWCPPCMKMLKTTFPDPRVASLLQQCVFLKIDTDKHPELAKHFGVVGLPDIRFLGPAGAEKKQLRDFQDAESFAAELETLLGSDGRKK